MVMEFSFYTSLRGERVWKPAPSGDRFVLQIKSLQKRRHREERQLWSHHI